MTVEAELRESIAEIEEEGGSPYIYGVLTHAQDLVNGLGPVAHERLDEAIAILETHREWSDAVEDRPLPSRLVELCTPLTPHERGSILRISTIVFALRAVRAADPHTLK